MPRLPLAALTISVISAVAVPLLAPPAAASPEEPPSGTLIERMREADRAIVLGDIGALRGVHDVLAAGLEKPGEGSSPRRYAMAYAAWRLNHLLESHEGKGGLKEGRPLLENAEVVLRALVEEHPEDAEAHALLGSVVGEQIGNSMWRGMRLGPKASGSLETAFGLAEGNPRVALQRGISFLFTPSLFGGGLDKAEAELRRAEALFQKEPGKGEWPKWGRVDAHIWLGIALVKKERFDEAREAYDRALALEPEYHWVREVLVPELETRAAKRKR